MAEPWTIRAAGRRAGGFTFIEVMIVVATLAIIATLVLPMVTSTETARLRAAARLLVADIEYAQIESMAHGDDPRILVLDAANDAYRIATVSAPDVPITSSLGSTPYETVFGADRAACLTGVTISGFSLDGDDRLGFGRYGSLDQLTPATITLACGGRTITITIDTDTGEATVGPVQ